MVFVTFFSNNHDIKGEDETSISDQSIRFRSTSTTRNDGVITTTSNPVKLYPINQQQLSSTHACNSCCRWKRWRTKKVAVRYNSLSIQLVHVILLGMVLLILIRFRISYTSISTTMQLHDSKSYSIQDAKSLVDVAYAKSRKKMISGTRNRVRKAKHQKNGKVPLTKASPSIKSMNDLDHPKLQLPEGSVMEREFPTFYAISKRYDIVGMYFAASWCPMSTPVTKLLDQTFRTYLSNIHNDVQKQDGKAKFGIIYVSSDETIESFQSYIQPGWDYIPYTNTEERSRIKQYFRTCAKREMEYLRIPERWYEIPNLIVLDTTRLTGINKINVITYHGIKDVQKYSNSNDILQYWTSATTLNLTSIK